MTTEELTPATTETPSQIPQASYSLMKIVILILGAGLIISIGTIAVLAVNKSTIPPELNTITSLIAGGLVGFLTPHAVNSLSNGKNG